MGTGTAPRVAGNGNHLAGHDGSPLPNQYLGKVAIADGIVAVTEGDELARTFVLPHLDPPRLTAWRRLLRLWHAGLFRCAELRFLLKGIGTETVG